MRIGILSDTHDRLPAIEAALRRFQALGIDTLIHPGDVVAPFAARLLAGFPGTTHITYGNNDGERKGLKQVLPQIQDGPLTIELANRRILVHHYLDWCDGRDLADADLVITGHTHEVAVNRQNGKLILNPGECCGYLTGRCTIAVVDLEQMDSQIIEIRL